MWCLEAPRRVGVRFFYLDMPHVFFFLCRFVIRQLALFFAIVGTVMWALSTTEFSLMSKLKNMWKVRHIFCMVYVSWTSSWAKFLPRLAALVFPHENSRTRGRRACAVQGSPQSSVSEPSWTTGLRQFCRPPFVAPCVCRRDTPPPPFQCPQSTQPPFPAHRPQVAPGYPRPSASPTPPPPFPALMSRATL